MKAKDFFDRLKMYDDLNVDILFKDGTSLYDILDLCVDVRNGNLVIIPKGV